MKGKWQIQSDYQAHKVDQCVVSKTDLTDSFWTTKDVDSKAEISHQLHREPVCLTAGSLIKKFMFTDEDFIARTRF